MENSMEVLQKTKKTELPYDPAIPLLAYIWGKPLTCKDTCSPVFIALQVTIKAWKQPKCAEERIKKMWDKVDVDTEDLYIVDYYSAMKRMK